LQRKADVGRCQATVRLKSTNVLERHRQRGGNSIKEKGAGRAVSCRCEARGGAVRRHASVRLKSTDAQARHRQRGGNSIKEKGDGRAVSCRCEARGGVVGLVQWREARAKNGQIRLAVRTGDRSGRYATWRMQCARERKRSRTQSRLQSATLPLGRTVWGARKRSPGALPPSRSPTRCAPESDGDPKRTRTQF